MKYKNDGIPFHKLLAARWDVQAPLANRDRSTLHNCVPASMKWRGGCYSPHQTREFYLWQCFQQLVKRSTAYVLWDIPKQLGLSYIVRIMQAALEMNKPVLHCQPLETDCRAKASPIFLKINPVSCSLWPLNKLLNPGWPRLPSLVTPCGRHVVLHSLMCPA